MYTDCSNCVGLGDKPTVTLLVISFRAAHGVLLATASHIDRARMTDQKAESASEDHSQWKLSRPAGVSTVWDWFKTFTNGHRKDLAVCNLCQTEVGRGPSSGTTNLKNHLTSYHPEKVINGVVERLQAVDGGMNRFLNKDLGFTDAYV